MNLVKGIIFLHGHCLGEGMNLPIEQVGRKGRKGRQEGNVSTWGYYKREFGKRGREHHLEAICVTLK